jgi:hypothetical protein
MEVRGNLQLADMRAAAWLHIKPRPTLAVIGVALVVLMVVVFCWSLLSMTTAEPPAVTWWLLAAMIYLSLLSFVWWPYRIRKLFNQSKALQRDFRLTPSERGVLVSNEDGEMTLPWSDYRKWKESEKVFLIYLTDAQFQVVPKRLFASASDIEAFRSVLKARIK